MKLANKQIVIVSADEFEDSELIFPLYRLREEGAEVILAGVKEKSAMIKGKGGVKMQLDKSVNEIDLDSVHAVVIPGGFGPDYIRMNERVQELLHHVHSKGGVVAAICHGPWALISAGLIKGHQCTSYFHIKDDLVNAGGNWQDAPVVVDNRVITSRAPPDLPDFCIAIIENVSKLNF
jgi:protease I